MAKNTPQSDLDAAQTISRAFVEADDAHRIDIVGVDPSVVIPVVSGGLNVLGSFIIPFSSIATGSPFVFTSGVTGTTQQVMVSDTCGQNDKIAFASEFFYTNPGCERVYQVQIPPSTPMSIQSMDVSAPVAGSFIVTLLGL